MNSAQIGSLKATATATLFGLGLISGSSADEAKEFMLRPQMYIPQRTTYSGTVEVSACFSSNQQVLSANEIVKWLRDEGMPIAIIAEIVSVERKSVYAWLEGGAIRSHNQERLDKIYSLLNENKITSLRQLYRFWSRNISGKRSLASLFHDKVLDEMSIRDVLFLLWPLAEKEQNRDLSCFLIQGSRKSNPIICESREVTTSHES